MQIQVNTDKNIAGREALVRKVEAGVETALARFSTHLTRVEVHLADESAGASTVADMRCTMEARPSGQQPVAVTHHADTLDEACRGAAQKLQNLLATRFGRLRDRKGGDTLRQAEPR
jgi:Sigma 54 modulation protein / S30EA ribosomal protein